MRSHPATLIQRKRDGGALSDGDLRDVVAGVVDGSLSDVQLGAFLMAVCCRGMTAAETASLTLAMRDSGLVLDLSSVPGRKIDKHSTGGVGDKVSLVLAPLVAAAGVPVPMISGRGLGHTGGTIDKLQAIPGYRVDLEPDEFVATLRACGFVMAAASARVAPADRRMYAARDVSGTVESIPLITASILSKKLAEGIDGLVMDVKTGRAAFLPAIDDARALMRGIVEVGNAAGVAVRALLTDMDRPLGRACGNALEVAEAVACLRGEGPPDLRQLVLALGVEMLQLADPTGDPDAAAARLRALLDGGDALHCLQRNLEHQGGDPRLGDAPGRVLAAAPATAPVLADGDGFVCDVDPLAVGVLVRDLGGGRRHSHDRIDPRVGVVFERAPGDGVRRGECLAVVHAADRAAAERGAEMLGAAIRIGGEEPELPPLVHETMRAGRGE